MPRAIYEYTKTILQKVSFDTSLFCKEVKKAANLLLPHELEELRLWLLQYTREKPELTACLTHLG